MDWIRFLFKLFSAMMLSLICGFVLTNSLVFFLNETNTFLNVVGVISAAVVIFLYLTAIVYVFRSTNKVKKHASKGV